MSVNFCLTEIGFTLANPAPIGDDICFHIEVTCNTALKHRVVWRLMCLKEEDDDYLVKLADDCMEVHCGISSIDLWSQGLRAHLHPFRTSNQVRKCVFKVVCAYRGMDFLGIEFPCNICFGNGPCTMRAIDERPCIRDIIFDEKRLIQIPFSEADELIMDMSHVSTPSSRN